MYERGIILKPERMDYGVREIKKKQEDQLGHQLVQTSLDLQKRKIQSIGKIDLLECVIACVHTCECVCMVERDWKEVQWLELRITGLLLLQLGLSFP